MSSVTAKSKRLLSLISLFFIALLFQNCDYSSDGPSINASTRDQNTADGMPFAFDVNIDHVAYMSCRGQNFHLNSNTPFFTFKAGGFSGGSGISLRENFLSQYGGFTENRLSELLDLSLRNSRTGVVMSVRESGQFQNVVRFNSFTGGEGDTTESVNGPGNSFAGLFYSPDQAFTLTNFDVLDILLDQRSAPTNYLRGLNASQSLRAFEGKINLFSDDDPSGQISPANGQDKRYRDLLQDQGYLTFTFATTDQERPGLRARSPFAPTGETAEGNRSVWGKGYQFNFSEYDNYVGTGFRSSSQKRAVAQTRAYDLETEASLNETWVCPDDQKYIIVRQQDATRRYDGIPLTASNHPFNEYDRVDPADPESALNPTTTYNDGGPVPGGYYYTYQADYDGNGELDYVRHKVICPLVADQIPADTPANQAEREAWERVRKVLPVEDWYVFRGSKYNCVVPKNDSGDICYAGGRNLNLGFDPNRPDNLIARNLVQYFANEDHPDIRIAHERYDLSDEDVEIPEIQITPDCGPSSSTAHGGFNYCPHVVSVCYRLN